MPVSNRVRRIVLSLLLLIPCFWTARIQSTDLGSHIYNAWLTQLVKAGQAPGLELASPSTNVLFDWMLESLLGPLGPDLAQGMAVSFAVLVFFWGAFAFLQALTVDGPWALAPSLAMLTYGWVFHMGLFNFYLSAGMSLVALAVAWKGSRAGMAAALPILALAWTAHSLPVAWAVAVFLYARAAGALDPGRRWILAGLALMALVAIRLFLDARFKTVWVSLQMFGLLAVDQVWVFGFKYYVLMIVMGILWSFLLLRLTHLSSFAGLLRQPSFQIAVLTALGVVLIPTSVNLPGRGMELSLIAERMTLLSGVVLCGVMAAAQPLRWQRISLTAVALVYFSFLFVDTRRLDQVESRMEHLLRGLPRGSRVVSSFYDPGSRVFLIAHTLDRACLGHCFSYGNYEPPSGWFRVRVKHDNPYVVTRGADSLAIDMGKYVVEPRDLPLYQVTLCGEELNTMCTKPLAAGETVKSNRVFWVTPKVWW